MPRHPKYVVYAADCRYGRRQVKREREREVYRPAMIISDRNTVVVRAIETA